MGREGFGGGGVQASKGIGRPTCDFDFSKQPDKVNPRYILYQKCFLTLSCFLINYRLSFHFATKGHFLFRVELISQQKVTC